MNKDEMIKGSIYGVAAGDALGAPCEFMRPDAVKLRWGTVDTMIKSYSWAAGEFTDDTWLTLATIRAYENYQTGGLDVPRAGQSMVIWMQNIGKGIGNMTNRALGKISSGQCTAYESGKKAAVNAAHGSAGNGSLMRCASTGLIHDSTKIDIITKEATVLSEITHADQRCVAACVAYNVILAHILDGKDFSESMTKAADAARQIDAETCNIIEEVMRGGGNTFDLNNMKNQGFVLRSLQRGLIAYRDGLNFKDPMVEIVNEGGDADTNGAVAGGLLGAKFGFSGIPSEWTSALQYQDEINEAVEIVRKARGI